ncbi:hypothetical protein CUU66_19135 [Peribacillus deserti]|uniref:Uncharacterized protein n=1 Tax=Peribacillus deserti TaxID=673318 RepID=A0A2N5M229_9BACI|nr:hypothetical protein CUU66_19135 [Peribacillus deserti]
MCEPGGATGRGRSSVVSATMATQQVFFIGLNKALPLFYQVRPRRRRRGGSPHAPKVREHPGTEINFLDNSNKVSENSLFLCIPAFLEALSFTA